MKDINDRNLSFFSPQPIMIAGFFLPQLCFQLAWLYRLWKLSPRKNEADGREVDQMVDFVPYYAIGNVSLGVWLFFWNAEQLKVADIFVIINTLTQIFYMVARLPKMNTASTSSVLTHVVSKTLAGIGVLDILHNTSIAYFKDASASVVVKALTAVGFGLGAASSDWIFGACLAYDLVALSVGQRPLDGGWSALLGMYAVGSAAITGLRNYFL